jgi:hypothetical protein
MKIENPQKDVAFELLTRSLCDEPAGILIVHRK